MELIELETSRRLHFNYDLTFQEIDDLELFHRPMRITNASGLIWETAQRWEAHGSDFIDTQQLFPHRDIPWWTGLSEHDLPNLPTSFVTSSPRIFDDIDQAMRDFCPSLNCLCTFCPTHSKLLPSNSPGSRSFSSSPHSDGVIPYLPEYMHPGLDPVKPVLLSTNLRLRDEDAESCGDYCFRLYEDDVYMVRAYLHLRAVSYTRYEFCRTAYIGKTTTTSNSSLAYSNLHQTKVHATWLSSAGKSVMKYVSKNSIYMAMGGGNPLLR